MHFVKVMVVEKYAHKIRTHICIVDGDSFFGNFNVLFHCYFPGYPC